MLQALVTELESYLPSLEAKRAIVAIANDCYEAAYYWRDLGRWVLESNTKVNYPERAKGERMWIAELQKSLAGKSPEDQVEYAPVLKAGSELLEIVATVQAPPDGHLGFLRMTRELFSFLRTEFHFREVETEPTSIRFTSGYVSIELQGSLDPWSSCSFGLETNSPKGFWIHDLLYLNHDDRYQSLPKRLDMRVPADIEEWFGFLAGVFKQYGTPVFEKRPGIFEALAEAQAERDAVYARDGSEIRGTGHLAPLTPLTPHRLSHPPPSHFQTLRQHPSLPNRRHKIRIARPPRQRMHMQMSRNPRAARSPNVQSNIETLRVIEAL